MSKGKLLAVVFVWLVLTAIVAAGYKLWIAPRQKIAEDNVAKDLLTNTSSASRYDHTITFALDGFSGYSTIRSPKFSEGLARHKIKLELIDDEANYSERLRGLQSGKYQMGVFTVDALIKASSELGQLPATIVLLIDETRGADAMVAYRSAIPNVDALNATDVKFIITPDSPSETLARVVMSRPTALCPTPPALRRP